MIVGFPGAHVTPWVGLLMSSAVAAPLPSMELIVSAGHRSRVGTYQYLRCGRKA